MNNDILDINEASEYLRIKKRTLYSLVSRGIVPGIKVGGQWRFKREMLDSLFNRTGTSGEEISRRISRLSVSRQS
jgi:excisionase family DNA binding protein